MRFLPLQSNRLVPHTLFRISAWCCLLAVSISCSTKKNTWVSRNFNSVTTHYNGWFYANEIINQQVDKTVKSYRDDYDRLLPIFVYGSIEDGKAMTPEMDKAFKKISKCIERHSMLIRDREYNPWIKKCYVLLGQTHFYKHDYFAGLEAFEFVANRNRKHPYRFEAMLWMLRVYNETGLFSRAQGLIDLIADEPRFPKSYRRDYYSLIADYHIKTANYPLAIKSLTKAINYSRRGKTKTRLTYILAQLYMKVKDEEMGARYFEKVTHMGPPYEMLFNARMNLASSMSSLAKGGKDVKKVLNRMLKDVKYADFRDQIYFALAKVYKKEGSIGAQADALTQSVRVSVKNKKQKGISAFTLGDVLYGQRKFLLAQQYYDTAVANLDDKFEDLEVIKLKRNSLSAMVKNLNTVVEEDSLQRIAKMSESERNQFVEDMIARLKKKEKEERDALEAAATSGNGIFTPSATSEALAPGGAWYFYNPNAISVGATEFQRKWGTRKLEDNWRRSVKQASSGPDDPTAGPDGKGKKDSSASKTNEPVSQVKSKEFYLSQLPTGDANLQKSSEKVMEALYNLGLIYKEQLNDLPNSLEAYEQLLKRFPKGKYELVAYYQLYRINLALENTAEANKYKDILLDRFPNSEYAELIRNPNYNADRDRKKNEAEIYYEETFALFQQNKYEEVYSRCLAADTLFGKSDYQPKYAFLQAMCTGRVVSKPAMIMALKRVIANFPKDPVKYRAEEVLALLEGQKNEIDSAKTESPFTDAPEKEHYFVLVVPVNTDMNQLKVLVSDFNAKNFSTSNLQTTDLLMGTEKKLVCVKSFENKVKAMNYYGMVQSDKSMLKNLPEGKYQYFVISAENYIRLYKMQETETYLKYFQKKYQKG